MNGILLKLVLVSLLFNKVQCLRKCYNKILQKPVVSALLDIHGGDNCEIVNYHGLQQMAILESTIKQINLELNPIGIELVLQIFDTCSTREDAQIAALKALVASKQTYMKQPLFLGFLGPENLLALSTVQDISVLFRIPHIVPHSFDRKLKNNVFQVAKYPLDQHSKVIQSFLNKFGLQKILLLIEDNDLSKWKANSLKSSLDQTYCLSPPYIIKKGNLQHLIEQLNEDFTAILAIIESPYLAETILEEIKLINITILLSVGRAGLISWPQSVDNAYMIQMISSSPIEGLNEAYNPMLITEFSNYMDIKCNSNFSTKNIICDPVQGLQQDWTVNLLQYGLLLYSANIKTAYFLKCHKESVQGLCPKLKYISRTEWNLLLSKTSFYIKPPPSINRNKVMSYNMDINASYVIMKLQDELKKVGEYRNGELILEDNYLEEQIQLINASIKCEPFKTQIFPTSTPIDKLFIPNYGDSTLFENIIDFRNLSYFQLFGYICGIGFGITIILTFVFYNVYRGFNIVTNNRSTGCSTTSS